MSSVVQNLKLAQVRIDGGTQPRMSLNEETVTEYGEAITDGAKFPPVTVFHDGADYWLADGFHRFFAHKNIGALDIEAEVQQGTKRDAILHSVGANDKHGLRRSNADKRKAVETLLNDAEWAKWSDREIARQCGVSAPFVGSVRRPEIRERQKENRATSAAKQTESCNPITPPNVSDGYSSHDASSSVSASPAPNDSHSKSDHEDHALDDFDPIVELELANKTIDQLNAQIKALTADDTAKQLEKEIRARQGIEARLGQEMNKANRLDNELRQYGKWAAGLRRLLRVESNSQVTAAVKSLIAEAA